MIIATSAFTTYADWFLYTVSQKTSQLYNLL